MPKLYELTADFAQAVERYNSAETQEDLDALAAQLESLEGAFNEKALAVGFHCLQLDSDINAIEEEIKRLQKKKKTLTNARSFFDGYLMDSMEHAKVTKVSSPTLTVEIRQNPPSVEVLDEEKVPKEYKREKITYEVDKRAILDLWRESNQTLGVEGTKVSRTQRLVIK